ncbi:MAG: flagellar filament capping protein FliD [Lachnospiraceae bacterium]|nr:flagellar filament capping protein FliD [Lachnospiraceae bacterium]
MPIRMTGLTSGLDTESIVSALVSSYSTKTEKYKKSQTKLSWKQDAWKSVNTDVHDLYTLAGQMKFSSAYSLKKTTVSDATKATVTASDSAPAGTRTLKINKLAQSAYMTGGKVSYTTTTTVENEDGTKTEKETENPITKDTVLSNLKGITLGSITTKDSDGKETSESATLFKVKVGTGDDAKTTQIKIGSTTKVSGLLSQLNAAGLNASFDETQKRFYISSKTSGAAGDFTIEADSDDPTNSAATIEALGLNVSSTDTDKKASKVEAQDSEIELNGVKYTSSGNDYNIDGLSITATQKTEGDGITITTNVDKQGIYDKIKDFFSKYNEVINSINKLYNADSAKDYEPLTDDEKAAMSDTEVEKWESKIKSALLRKDSTLGDIISSMNSAMQGQFTVGATTVEEKDENGNTVKKTEGGTKMSLVSDFGIHTLSYFVVEDNENYAFHIDGDEDDASVSGNTDKLMAAINKDPDQVIDFMKALSSNLYDKLGAKMKSTSLSSAYTIYNDKEMASEYSDYTTLISKWESKLEDMEDAYYKKFSTMESALTKMQSSTSSLSGMLG